jgi:hypothetical protein
VNTIRQTYNCVFYTLALNICLNQFLTLDVDKLASWFISYEVKENKRLGLSEVVQLVSSSSTPIGSISH